jgi:hypothetical protein
LLSPPSSTPPPHSTPIYTPFSSSTPILPQNTFSLPHSSSSSSS